jgi:hypothetical protein
MATRKQNFETADQSMAVLADMNSEDFDGQTYRQAVATVFTERLRIKSLDPWVDSWNAITSSVERLRTVVNVLAECQPEFNLDGIAGTSPGSIRQTMERDPSAAVARNAREGLKAAIATHLRVVTREPSLQSA